LSRVATAALCGHDSSKGATYADWYDNPGHEDLIAEQRRVFPDGLLALITDPKTRLMDNIPPELVSLWTKLSAFEIGEFEVAAELGRLVREQRAKSDPLYTQKQRQKGFKTAEIECINSTGRSGEPIPECPAGPNTLETLSLSFSCSPSFLTYASPYAHVAGLQGESERVEHLQSANSTSICAFRTPQIPPDNSFWYPAYTKSTEIGLLGTPSGTSFGAEGGF
jgi:hypothetical protein